MIVTYFYLKGRKYGRLAVVERVANKGDKVAWKCKCDCGNETIVTTTALQSGNTKSCGCLLHERITKHGMYKTKLYKTWNNMISRCYCNSFRNFKNYGGRGITVCKEWKEDFQTFADLALSHGYSDELTLDRIDVNGNYEPSNCRWITNKEQQHNKRSNRYITFNGKTHTLKQWSEITGIHPKTISTRIDRGWTIEEALTKGVI
jgi:hypothetical protein